MTPVAFFELTLLLMAVVVILELIARRLHMPPAGAFIIGGIALALIPGTPSLRLDPDLVLVLFLPPLLMAGGFFTAWRDFRANLRIILQLAVGAVAFTTLLVGLVTHILVPGLPWAACFALGAIVSPPDAVAAHAILQTVRLPKRLSVLLEGESLVNDASSLVLFRFAVAAGLSGLFSIRDAAISFMTLSVGGVATGIAIAFAVILVLSRLRDPVLAVIVSLLTSWASYIGAEEIHVSGVLSAVSCGLVLGWYQHSTLTAEIRIQARAVWATMSFVLESLVFVLIGLSLRGVLDRLGGWHASAALLPVTGAVVGTVILSRFLWIFAAAYAPRALLTGQRKHEPYPPFGLPFVLSWAGMRGVVSLAAALSLPEHFPGRDFILAASFAVIMVTVLVQGATLAPLIQLLRLGHIQGISGTISEAAARARVAQAQLAVVEHDSLGADGAHRHLRLHQQYGFRAEASTRFAEAQSEFVELRRAHFTTVLAAIGAGRKEILRLHRAGEIHDEVLNTLEEELDLEEVGTRRLLGGEATADIRPS